jgi:hypothetical protein
VVFFEIVRAQSKSKTAGVSSILGALTVAVRISSDSARGGFGEARKSRNAFNGPQTPAPSPKRLIQLLHRTSCAPTIFPQHFE